MSKSNPWRNSGTRWFNLHVDDVPPDEVLEAESAVIEDGVDE